MFSGAVGPEAGPASLGLEAEMLENILVRRLADLTAVLGLGWAASRQVVPDADVSVARGQLYLGVRLGWRRIEPLRLASRL